jgi:hypothetical protein
MNAQKRSEWKASFKNTPYNDPSLLREFDTGQAVVVDSDRTPLQQLVKFRKTSRGHIEFAVSDIALVFSSKKEAINLCRNRHWPQYLVTRGSNLASDFWFVQYAPFSDYALACWET